MVTRRHQAAKGPKVPDVSQCHTHQAVEAPSTSPIDWARTISLVFEQERTSWIFCAVTVRYRSHFACRSPTWEPVAIASHNSIAQRGDPRDRWSQKDPSGDRPQPASRHQRTSDSTGTLVTPIAIDPPRRTGQLVVAQLQLCNVTWRETLPGNRGWATVLGPASGDPVGRGRAEAAVAVVDKSAATFFHNRRLVGIGRKAWPERDSVHLVLPD
jgi:hypothetical protein